MSITSCLLDVKKVGLLPLFIMSNNIIKQGLTSVVNVRTFPGGVMRVCITADDQVSSISPANCHQPFQFPRRWRFHVIVWKVGRSENILPRPPTTRRYNFYCREVPRTDASAAVSESLS